MAMSAAEAAAKIDPSLLLQGQFLTELKVIGIPILMTTAILYCIGAYRHRHTDSWPMMLRAVIFFGLARFLFTL